MTNVSKPMPRDGRLIALILASKGVGDADDRVIHQLLDFSHPFDGALADRRNRVIVDITGYTADVLMDAQTYADHAGRGGKVEKEDIELAVQARAGWEFDEAPPRDYLASLAVDLNSIPLPPISESFETVRLPPPADRLTSVAFDVIPNAPPRSEAIVDTESESGSDQDGDGDAEMEDADMEEVKPDANGVAEDKVESREVDEDYD